MFDQMPDQPITVTLYTDAYVVRGTVNSRHRRVSDILNMAPEAFIVLSDVTMDEWGSTATPVRADYAQVNLGSVLFAVADTMVEATPELRLVKIPEQAFISVPPFRIVGNIHLPPEQNMRLALGELIGRFVPVTDATFWSDTVGEAKTSAVMVAVNHARAQILAPHTDIDPWVGLDRSVGLGGPLSPEAGPPEPGGASPAAPPSSDAGPPPAEGWATGPTEAAPRDVWGMPVAQPAADPWVSPAGQDSWATGPKPAPPTPAIPTVPPSRTGLLGRVHGTSGGMDLPRPTDEPDPYDKG
jgi:hypothetical protein